MQAGTDSVNSMVEVAPGFREAMRNLVSGVAEPWDDNIDSNSPVIIPTLYPTSAPIYTSTPDMFQLTATAYFGDFPTALPQSTPEPTATNRPMIQPTRTAVPSPTPCVASKPGDLQRGCVPPTPIPSN